MSLTEAAAVQCERVAEDDLQQLAFALDRLRLQAQGYLRTATSESLKNAVRAAQRHLDDAARYLASSEVNIRDSTYSTAQACIESAGRDLRRVGEAMRKGGPDAAFTPP